MNIIIRNALQSDYEQIENIMTQAHRMHVEWRDDIYRMNDPILSYERFMNLLSEETYIVAQKDEDVVGILYYFFKNTDIPSMQKRKVLYIDTMAVEENFRGMGVGTAMFDHIKNIAKANDCTHMELSVNAKNINAQKMYAKYGFSEKSYTLDMKLD